MMTLEQFQGMTPEKQAAILAAMQTSRQTKLTMKVSEKGAMSIYGFGKWPVTLYKSQWSKLLANVAEIEAFLKANDHLLAEKL